MKWLRIAQCDLRRILKDWQIIIWWFAMPMAFVYMFGLVFSQNRDNRTWMHVIKLDDHALADIFIDTLHKPDFNETVGGQKDEFHIWSRTIILPATFSSAILAGERVEFPFAENTQQDSMSRLLSAKANVVRGIVKFTSAAARANIANKEWNETTKQALLAELDRPRILRVETKQHFSLRPPPSGFGITLPAYLIMFVLMNAIMYGGITLTYERQYKQLIRLRAAPLTPLDIFMGKLLARVLQPILQTILLLFAGNLLMGVSLGDHPLALIPVVICFSLCCGTFGLFFGSVCKSEPQVVGLGIMTTMVMSAMGGCWFPMEMMPESFLMLSRFTPVYWGLHALQDVMAFGRGVEGIITECLILLAFSIAILAISIPLFQRNQG
ncbi:ABC transporter permease subunit [bacterium]|nr:ABC transporter permease subunit [bacterium]